MAASTPRPRNPYITGNPVGSGPSFIGREDVLRAVHRVLRDPDHRGIVLYGQRRIGKTSILQHLTATLASHGPFRTVYFDLQDKARLPLSEVVDALAKRIAKDLGLDAPRPEGEVPAWFRGAWLPSVLAGLPADTSLVVLFDEFDVLADVRAENAAAALFPYLRELLAESEGRVRFVFVIGRNIADLANFAGALFKGLPAERVSLLARPDAERLILMAQENGSLRWDPGAVASAWELTNGHPMLLQQLCWEVWEELHAGDEDFPQATAGAVDDAVPHTLVAARNALDWLWSGLPPAERVVASALASAGAGALTQDALEEVLRQAGIRVVIRELREAPHVLQDWDLIEPADGGYRFRVELLRRWIVEARPLARVQRDLDLIEPLAEQLYRTAELQYKVGDLDPATQQLRQALRSNPNHLRASELLADILISQRAWADARKVLEDLYGKQPVAARGRLVQVLTALKDEAPDEDARVALLDRLLELQDDAGLKAERSEILEDKGDRARAQGDLETAIDYYRRAGADELARDTGHAMRRAKLDEVLGEVLALEEKGEIAAAYDRLAEGAKELPDIHDWDGELRKREHAAHLDRAYRRAEQAIARGEKTAAVQALAEVLAREPGYRDTARRVYELVTGTRVQAALATGGFAIFAALGLLITVVVLFLRLDTARKGWEEAGHELGNTRGELEQRTRERDEARDKARQALAERDEHDAKRRLRLLEKGALEIERLTVVAKVRDAEGKCMIEIRNPSAPLPAADTCFVGFELKLRNNAPGLDPPRGLLCVKLVDRSGSVQQPQVYKGVLYGHIEVWNTPGSPCTLISWLGSQRSTPPLFAGPGEETATTMPALGSWEGRYFKGYLGSYRVEVSWFDRKLGEASFEFTGSSKP